MNAPASTALNIRQNDPDRLLRDWQTLLSEHDHLHAPEAARLLGVPEAALVASRIGRGAVRLKPDVDRLLAHVDDWGRVLCAFSNPCGVHMPLGAVRAAPDAGTVGLRSDALDARIDRHAVAHAFLFEDEDDGHGRTRSLQLFDAGGGPVLKLFIFHKTRFETARRHFGALTQEDQSRTFEPTPAAETPFDAQALSTTSDPDMSPEPGPFPERIAAMFDRSGHYDVEMVAPHAWVRWSGAIDGVRLDDAMFHLHETEVRSHLRFAAIDGLSRTESGALALNGPDGRLIRIARKDAP